MEFWDIYDINKRPTGRTMKRNDWCLKDGEYHLTVLGVIARPDGTFLITRRVMTKAWAPGWWEVSGGAAKAGEASYDAVLREVKEETGLDVSCAQGGYLFYGWGSHGQYPYIHINGKSFFAGYESTHANGGAVFFSVHQGDTVTISDYQQYYFYFIPCK